MSNLHVSLLLLLLLLLHAIASASTTPSFDHVCVAWKSAFCWISPQSTAPPSNRLFGRAFTDWRETISRTSGCLLRAKNDARNNPQPQLLSGGHKRTSVCSPPRSVSGWQRVEDSMVGITGYHQSIGIKKEGCDSLKLA
ncbi:hypothetical protein BD289DRAFT_448994 [Coniella lustricola]|uniref:Secreted protein n=1 Tax=Coniella lustricola TaxID=2025994 RepID=A0A2T2ZRJ6_9PEZI|nr:hypothetical protein BD289DRAFT_448994 [Coniella lustricola]